MVKRKGRRGNRASGGRASNSSPRASEGYGAKAKDRGFFDFEDFEDYFERFGPDAFRHFEQQQRQSSHQHSQRNRYQSRTESGQWHHQGGTHRHQNNHSHDQHDHSSYDDPSGQHSRASEQYLSYLAFFQSATGHHSCSSDSYCSDCQHRATIYLSLAESSDKKRAQDRDKLCGWVLRWSLGITLVMALPYYYSLRMQGWFVRSLCILGVHMSGFCVPLSFICLHLSNRFVQKVYHRDKTNHAHHTISDRVNHRLTYEASYRTWHFDDFVHGTFMLFLAGVLLELATVLIFVTAFIPTALKLLWQVLCYIVSLPFDVLFWALARVIRVVAWTAKIAAWAVRGVSKPAFHLGKLAISYSAAFTKLFGRTFLQLVRSLAVFSVDLSKVLILVAAIYLFVILARLALGFISTTITGVSEQSPKHEAAARTDRDSNFTAETQYIHQHPSSDPLLHGETRPAHASSGSGQGNSPRAVDAGNVPEPPAHAAQAQNVKKRRRKR